MNWLQHLTNFLTCIAEFLMFYQFYNNFLRLKIHRQKNVAVMILIFTCTLTIINYFKIALLNTISISLLAFIFSIIFFHGKKIVQAVLTFIICGLFVVAEFAAGFGMTLVLNIELADAIAVPYYILVIGTISKILSFLIVRTIIYIFPKKQYKEVSRKSILLMLFPLLSSANMYLLMYLESDHPAKTSELLLMTLIGIGLLISSVAIFAVYDSSMQKQELENKVQLSESREEANNALYLQQKRSIEENRALLHDFKNQLVTLDLLYKAGGQNTEGYRESLLHALEEQAGSNPIDVKNAVVSNILANTKNRCAQKGILFTAEIACDDLSFLEYMDADSILNNALDNAMTACEELPEGADKFISVKLYRASYFHVLKVCNSRANELREKNGELFTTKGDSLRHGMGLKNIRRAAEKYSGDISCQYDSESFMLVVRLKPVQEMADATV